MPTSPPGQTESTSAVLDARAQRAAQARAQAAAIVDRPRTAPRFNGDPVGDREQPGRQRRHAPRERRRLRDIPGLKQRVLSFLILAVQCGVLAAMLLAPGIQVHTITVTGNRLVSTAEILEQGAVPSGSLLAVNPNLIEARISAIPWIRSVTVTDTLPNTVHISVTEWPPAMWLHSNGADELLSTSGADLPTAAGTPGLINGVPLYLDDFHTSVVPPSTQLIAILSQEAARFPSLFDTTVVAFQLRSDDVLEIWTAKGWGVVIGHVDGADEVAQVPQQLASLAALRTHLNFPAPHFAYIDVEAVTAVAVGAGEPALPAALTTQIAAAQQSAQPTALADRIGAVLKAGFTEWNTLNAVGLKAAAAANAPVPQPPVWSVPAPGSAATTSPSSAASPGAGPTATATPAPTAAPTATPAPTPTPYSFTPGQ